MRQPRYVWCTSVILCTTHLAHLPGTSARTALIAIFGFAAAFASRTLLGARITVAGAVFASHINHLLTRYQE